MDKSGKNLELQGLGDLVSGLRGREFKDVNRALRNHARVIADHCVPAVKVAVARSQAPQAAAMVPTVDSVRDRIPVISIGKTNPKLKKFTRRGATRKSGKPRTGGFDSKARRGALAHGVVYGPLGGKRNTTARENYYRIGRNANGGNVGKALTESGAVFRQAEIAYLEAYLDILKAAGFDVTEGR